MEEEQVVDEPMEVEQVQAPKKKRTRAPATNDNAFAVVWAAHERANFKVGEHTATEDSIRAFTNDPEWKRSFAGVTSWTDTDCCKSCSLWYNAQPRDDGKRRKRAA